MEKMPRPEVTRVVEDYVTLVWKAYEWPGGEPTTTDLAAQLGVTPSTVSANLKKLARDGWIEYEPYGAITLTEEGRKVAVEIVRRHRLLETYLVTELGLPWDQVHDEADRLEHAISDLVLDRMDEALGHPTVDPHGDPIPTRDGVARSDTTIPLTESLVGALVRIARVSDRSPEVLRQLDTQSITVGTRVRVEEVNAVLEAVTIATATSTVQLSMRVASTIRVRPA